MKNLRAFLTTLAVGATVFTLAQTGVQAAGRWQPATEAQIDLVNSFKKQYEVVRLSAPPA